MSAHAIATLGPIVLVAVAGRVRLRRKRPPEPQARPIEAIAQDAFRLGVLMRRANKGVSFARIEGARRAYDRVLGEACCALEVAHLLDVLSPGPDLDVERLRVERLLDAAGLRLDDAA